MSTQKHQALVRRCIDAVACDDLVELDERVAPDVVPCDTVGPGRRVGWRR